LLSYSTECGSGSLHFKQKYSLQLGKRFGAKNSAHFLTKFEICDDQVSMIKQFIKSSLKCFKKWRERRKRKAHKVENGYRESVARATFWHQAKLQSLGLNSMYMRCLKSGSRKSFARANNLAPSKVSKFVMKLAIMIKFQYLSILDKLFFARV
jgi:hypothetical protein